MPTQLFKLISASLLACAFAVPCCSAQSTEQGTPFPGDTQQPGHIAQDWEAQQKREMLKKQNAQRQQQLRRDSEKLLELATELKHSVDKSDQNTLSVDVIKKAEEIEKLARSVKEKMKGS